MQTGDAIHILRNNEKTYFRIPQTLEISKVINKKKIDKSTDMKMSQLTNNYQRFNQAPGAGAGGAGGGGGGLTK